MLKNLLRPDSPLMIVMTQITDCIFLSMFFILGCFPVITVGASLAALYDAIYRGFRTGERNTWQRFFSTYFHSLKSSLLPSLLFLALAGGLGYGMIQCWNAAVYGQISWMVFTAIALVAALVVGVLSVLFPMLSRFENNLGALLKNTLVLALANAPRTLMLGILNAAALLLCIRFIIPLFFMPGLAAILSTYLIEPMFRPFMPPEEDESEDSCEEAAE